MLTIKNIPAKKNLPKIYFPQKNFPTKKNSFEIKNCFRKKFTIKNSRKNFYMKKYIAYKKNSTQNNLQPGKKTA